MFQLLMQFKTRSGVTLDSDACAANLTVEFCVLTLHVHVTDIFTKTKTKKN